MKVLVIIVLSSICFSSTKAVPLVPSPGSGSGLLGIDSEDLIPNFHVESIASAIEVRYC